ATNTWCPRASWSGALAASPAGKPASPWSERRKVTVQAPTKPEETRESARAKSTDADRLVIFGITGDLAKVMTFRSLYRLEKRGLSASPLAGARADAWPPHKHNTPPRPSTAPPGEQTDEAVFRPFAPRLSYVSGNFDDDATYERVATEIDGATLPVFYLEIPPFLFGRVVQGLAEAKLTKNARVVVEKPFGHDLASADALAAELHSYIDESQ